MLVTPGEAKRLGVYVKPTVTLHRVELEEWVAASPQTTSASISIKNWEVDSNNIVGDAEDETEGGTFFVAWPSN
jgi:hypothetical protein